MIRVLKTTYRPELRAGYGYIVKYRNAEKFFPESEKKNISAFILDLWEKDFFPEKAFIYACGNELGKSALYCTYEKKN